jgi:hypothetical protein
MATGNTVTSRFIMQAGGFQGDRHE